MMQIKAVYFSSALLIDYIEHFRIDLIAFLKFWVYTFYHVCWTINVCHRWLCSRSATHLSAFNYVGIDIS